MYSDIICTKKLEGAVVASSWVRTENDWHRFHAKNVADDDLTTNWVPNCRPLEGTWTGCYPKEEWIGYEFPAAVGVACARLFQSDAYVENDERRTLAEIVVLQRWTGRTWHDHLQVPLRGK